MKNYQCLSVFQKKLMHFYKILIISHKKMCPIIAHVFDVFLHSRSHNLSMLKITFIEIQISGSSFSSFSFEPCCIPSYFVKRATIILKDTLQSLDVSNKKLLKELPLICSSIKVIFNIDRL